MVYMILLLDKLYSIDKLLSLLHISDTIFLRKNYYNYQVFFSYRAQAHAFKRQENVLQHSFN